MSQGIWDHEEIIRLGQNFFISWFTGSFFFRFRVGETKQINENVLKMTSFVNSLDPDQAQQKVSPNVDPICLTLRWYS